MNLRSVQRWSVLDQSNERGRGMGGGNDEGKDEV